MLFLMKRPVTGRIREPKADTDTGGRKSYTAYLILCLTVYIVAPQLSYIAQL
uniref:Uncharacterized protein n=1 Tax=Anguilla anguilla TaxID=7936 RepID=A0A0E9VL25_ANGAN